MILINGIDVSDVAPRQRVVQMPDLKLRDHGDRLLSKTPFESPELQSMILKTINSLHLSSGPDIFLPVDEKTFHIDTCK